jgi:hypothetical protein
MASYVDYECIKDSGLAVEKTAYSFASSLGRGIGSQSRFVRFGHGIERQKA